MGFPNPEQEKVITHKGRPLVVIAGPGTGKTTTIVARMVNLLKENPNREVSFITFTRSSRRDTEKKVQCEVGKEAFEGTKVELPRVSTLHTYAKSMVHKFAELIGRDSNFSVLIGDKKEKELLLSELLNDLNINVITPSRLNSDCSTFRCTGSWPDDCPIELAKRQESLEYFDVLLRFYNTFDMEGLVQAACDILAKKSPYFPSVFLQVDEYQDLNPADQHLISLISSVQGSQVVVVGDDAQSIYRLRHANLNGIRDLWNSDEWEKARFIESHRLPSHILRASQALIAGKGYLGGELCVPEDEGRKIPTFQCTTSPLQIDVVAKLINDLMQTNVDREGRPLSYKDFMILCPTADLVSYVARDIEKKHGIPAKTRPKDTIPDDHWRLLLVLRMLAYSDSLALRQWLDIIGLDPTTITKIRRDAMAASETLFQYCSKLETPCIKEVFINLKKLRSSYDDLYLFRRLLKETPNLIVEDSLFPEVGITISEVTQKPNSIYEIIVFIHKKYGLLDPEADVTGEDKVFVATIHSAKGLEAEYVFIMWLNDTFMPSRGHDPEEELRVLYVALTRAKEDTILTFNETYNPSQGGRVQAVSPFLKKISSHLAIKRVRKSDIKSVCA